MGADAARPPAPERWAFDWGDVRGELQSLGGMLGPVHFALPSGRTVQPFAVAPWSDDPAADLETLPPLLRHLRGEWPCVPFGVPDARTDLPARWMAGVDVAAPADDAFVHGHASNHAWSLVERGDDSLDIAIDYPDAHPVRRLARRVRRSGPGALELTLRVEVRRRTRLPMGLHPVFALPERPGGARLAVPSTAPVRTFPVDVEPGVSVLRPDATATSLRTLPGKDGVARDLTRLPLIDETEELVLVAPTEGSIGLENVAEAHRVTLTWDIGVFPRCLLWLSNGGRSGYPWNGRFQAIGIEPVAAAFDLGQRHSENGSSPLREDGHRTTVSLAPGSPLVTRYGISVT